LALRLTSIKAPVYTEDEAGVAQRNSLFVLLRRVILRRARLGRATHVRNKTNKWLRLARAGFNPIWPIASNLAPRQRVPRATH